MAARVNFTEDRRKQLGREILTQVNDALRSSADARADAAVVRAMYYGQAGRDILPYAGASDIHLPVVADKVETFVPKAKNALIGADPIVRLRRAGNHEFAEDDTRDQEDFLGWALENDIEGFDETLESWIRNSCLDPVSVLKCYYGQTWRDTVDVRRLKKFWRPGDVDITGTEIEQEAEKTTDELFTDLFGPPPQFQGDNGILAREQVDNTTWTVAFVEDRRLYQDVRVEFVNTEFIDEVEARIFRRVLVREGVNIENVEFEDIIVPFRTKDVQDAEFVAHVYWMDYRDIEDKKNEGAWSLTDLDLKLLRTNKTRTQYELEQAEDTKHVKDSAVGESQTTLNQGNMPAYKGGKCAVLEVYRKDRPSKSARATELVYQMPVGLEKVVEAVYLDSVFPHGMRPFLVARYLPVSDRWFGVSMGRLLLGIQQQVNTTINQINDNQELINHPFFFYVPAAVNLDPRIIEGVEPGQGIPVADVNSIYFPQWTQQPLANLSTGLDSVLLFADRLTTSAMSGGSPQVRNAPRTARATFAYMGESNNKIDMYVRRLHKGGWRGLIHQAFTLLTELGPDEKWYYVMGNKQRRRISAKQLRGQYEYIFHGNVVNTNPEIMRALAQQRYTLARLDPLYTNDPAAAQNLLRDMLRHTSEGSTNVELLIPKVPQQGSGAFPMTPNMAIQALSRGIMVQAHPAEDHAEHLKQLQAFTQSPNFDNVDPSFVGLFAVVMRQHEQYMAQAMAQAQANAGMAGGAEQSVPSDVGLGFLEGGAV